MQVAAAWALVILRSAASSSAREPCCSLTATAEGEPGFAEGLTVTERVYASLSVHSTSTSERYSVGCLEGSSHAEVADGGTAPTAGRRSPVGRASALPAPGSSVSRSGRLPGPCREPDRLRGRR